MSMSAEHIMKVLAFSYRRHSFFTVFQNAVSDMAALLIAPSCCGLGGMSKVSARGVCDEQVVVHCGETKSMVSFAQTIRGLWCQSQGIPNTRG